MPRKGENIYKRKDITNREMPMEVSDMDTFMPEVIPK